MQVSNRIRRCLWSPACPGRAPRHKRRGYSRRPRLECLEERNLFAGHTLAAATPLVLTSGQAAATADLGQQPDFYAVTLTDDGRLTAQVHPNGFETRLSLLSADGSVLVQSDGQSATNLDDGIDLHLDGSAAGTSYYLEVEGLGGASGSYDIQARFAAATPPFQPLSTGLQSWGHTFDLNHDGIPDLVVANFGTQDVSVLLGRGDGTFAPEASYPVGVPPDDVVAADLTGTGISDLITANVDGSLTIFPGNGDGTFGAATVLPGVANDPTALVAGDFSGAGHMDLAFADANTGEVGVLLGNGDGTFATPTYYTVGSGPDDIIVADLNHNGRLDLVTANGNANTVSVLMGNGDGTFQAARTFAVGQEPRTLVAADFRGDGRLDIATANFASNDVSVLLNNGDGTFSAATSLAAGAGTTGIVAGAFHGAGRVDLAVTNQKDGTLSIFTGHGDGTFAPQTTISVGSAPGFLSAADFSGDGRLDLAHGDATGHVFVDLGRGDGTFQTLPPIASDAGVYAITTATFTTDGHVDLATVDQSTGDVEILLGRGDGTFQFGGRYAAGPDPMSIATGDFNHDGITDLVVTNPSADTVAILMGHGDGTFGPPGFFATGVFPKAVVTGDFNGDGNLDLAVADTGSDSVSILDGNGNGTFAAPRDYVVDTAPIALVAGDFTGNGILDLATANVVGNDVSVLVGRGDGTFANAVQLPAGNAPLAIVAGDFAGTGILDLATANASGSVSVFIGRGDGTFAPQVSYAVAIAPSDLVAADFSRNGNLDLAVTDAATGNLTVLRGQGDGTFQPSLPVAVGGEPQGVAAGDFTGDGLPDLVTANFDTSTISVLLNEGDAAFASPRQVAIAGGPGAIATADFTDSGHLDLVTANPTLADIQISAGNGDGTFADPITIPVPGEPVAVATGDFNDDGRRDIAVADYLTNSVSILFGVGDGTFRAPVSYAVGSQPDAIVAGDFSGNGLWDLAVANFASGTVSILLGQRDGTFTTLPPIAVGAGPVSLAVGDINGDGVRDLAVANALSRSISVIEQTASGTFYLAQTIALPVTPTAVTLGDFQGGGRLDIATADEGSNAVSVLINDGGGKFEAPVQYAVAGGPVSLRAGQFTNDGHVDLALADYESGDVTLLAGRGDGTFQARPPFAVGPYPLALIAGDFSGDGYLDIATANALGPPVSVGIAVGAGTFAQPALVASPVRSTPLVADFAGDGQKDVAVLADNGDILVRFADPGSPRTFEPPLIINPASDEKAREIALLAEFGKTYLIALSAQRDSAFLFQDVPGHGFTLVNRIPIPDGLASHIITGDLNGDGNDVAVLTLPATGQILMEGPEEWLAGLPPRPIDVGPAPSNVTLADTTGAGRLDIVVTDQFTGDVRVLYNDPAAPFQRQACFRAGTGLASLEPSGSSFQLHSSDAPIDLVSGNFSGQAGQDVVVVNEGDNRIAFLRNDGHGGFLNPESPPNFFSGGEPVAVVAGRFTVGPYLDLAVLNKASGDITIFLGDGHGGFTRGETVSAGNDPTGLSVADINGDGKLELLVSNGQGDVLILQGNGDGTFAQYQRIDRNTTLAITTLNGRQVFVYADSALDQVTVQYQQSGQTFQQNRQNGVLDPSDVEFADLNGDGIPDLIVANGGGNDVLVYLGLGNGRFGPPQAFPVGTNPVGVTVADLTGNGIPDLVVANSGSNDVSILLGSGQGSSWTLTPGPRLNVGPGPVFTSVIGGNGDVEPALIVCNSQSNNVYILQNLGNGFFDDRHPQVLAAGLDPVQAFVGNFDDNGDLDLAVLNAGSNSITVFPNFSSPGRTVSSGGLDPVSAVMFNKDGQSGLIVANQGDNELALLLGGPTGLHLVSTMPMPNGLLPTSLALASLTNTRVDFYATTSGKDVAYPLSFALSGTPAEAIGPSVSTGLTAAYAPGAFSNFVTVLTAQSTSTPAFLFVIGVTGQSGSTPVFITDLSTPLPPLTSLATASEREQVTRFAAIDDSAFGMVATLVIDGGGDLRREDMTLPRRDERSAPAALPPAVHDLNLFLMGLEDVPPPPAAPEAELEGAMLSRPELQGQSDLSFSARWRARNDKSDSVPGDADLAAIVAGLARERCAVPVNNPFADIEAERAGALLGALAAVGVLPAVHFPSRTELLAKRTTDEPV